MGAVVGGVIGYSFSYYFFPGFKFDFLPDHLSYPPVVATAMVSGAIGIFTAIFENDYRIASKTKNSKLKLEEEKRRRLLEPQIELYELALANLRSNGFEVYSNDFSNWIFEFIERNKEKEVQRELEEEDVPINCKTVREQMHELRRELKLKIEREPAFVFLKFLKTDDDYKIKIPHSPYKVFNKDGKEVRKFISIRQLYDFSANLKGSLEK